MKTSLARLKRFTDEHAGRVRERIFPLGLACVFAVIHYASGADSLDVWHWRNPLPQGDALCAVAFGNGSWVAVGGNNVVTSSNLVQWDARMATTNSLTGVAYGNGRFVAVGADWGHPSGCIITSTDNGASWAQSAVPNNYLSAVTFGGGRFVAVGAAGLILTSTDGVKWSPQTTRFNYWLTAVTWGRDKYLAVGYNGEVLTSANGHDWSMAPAPGTGVAGVTGVAYGNGIFAVVNANSGVVSTSTDGIRWSKTSTGNSSGYFGITHGASGFVAAGQSGSVLTSTDGTTWTNQNLTGYTVTLKGVAQNEENLVVVGEGGLIFVSNDGDDWQQVTAGYIDDWFAIAHGGGRFVVPGYQSPVILVSTNGIQWDECPLPRAGYFLSAAWGNDTFSAVGNGGSICTSADGLNWAYQSIGISPNLEGITFGQGRFVAVGESGVVLTSTDGSQWDFQFLPAAALHGVAFGDGRFVATGAKGAVFISTNGFQWQSGQSGRSENLMGVTYGNGRFLAFTDAGQMITSMNGTAWTSSRNVNSARALAFGNGYFLAGSSGSGLWTSSNGVDWQSRSALQDKVIENFAFGNGTFVAVGSGGIILQSDPLPAPLAVTVQTQVTPFPIQCQFTVDGTAYSSDQGFEWAPGSTHAIATASAQETDPGVRGVWRGWSDKGAISHTVAPTTATNYTATFTTEYRLKTTADAGGVARPLTVWTNHGATVTISAVPKSGCLFKGWLGAGANAYSGSSMTATVTVNGPISETATFIDPVPPTNRITAPKPGQVWSNLQFTVSGKAGDNAAVSNVFYRINDGPWSLAITINGWSTWMGDGALIAGSNSILAYAVDTAGNPSLTNRLAIFYLFRPRIALNVAGKGTLSGATNGQPFAIGQKVSLTARPTTGYVLTNWLVQVGGLTVLSTNRAVPFAMQSNLVLTVTFADVAKPTLTITAPKAGQRWSDELFTVAGKVTDNGPGGTVWCQINGGAWQSASGWSNWTANVTLVPGTNTVKAFAMDAAGNHSFTNSQKVVRVITYWLPDYSSRLSPDNRFIYDGIDTSGKPSQLEIRIADTNFPITCYSGRRPVTSYIRNVVKEHEAYGSYDSTTGMFSSYHDWDDYMTLAGGWGIWGEDDPPNSIRFGSGFVITNRLAVGQTVTLTRNAYNNGVYAAQAVFELRLVGVVDVTVPAGTFTNCLLLRSTLGIGGQRQVQDQWVAPGVGTVKEAGVSGFGAAAREQLISYWIQPADSSSSVLAKNEQQPLVPSLTIYWANGQPCFLLSGAVNHAFTVEYATNLAESDWQQLLEIPSLPASPYGFRDTATNATSRFYRIIDRGPGAGGNDSP